MNKLKIATLLFLLTLAFGNAQGQEISTILGTWTGDTDKVGLYRVEDGKLISEGISMLNDKKQFVFAVNQSESAFYVIGIGPVARANKYIFYMKPGDKLNVDINNPQFDYKLLGSNNSPENVELKKWFDLSHEIQMLASYSFRLKGGATYVQFFPALDELVEINENYTVKENVEKEFAEKFESLRNLDLVHNSLLLLFTPRSAHAAEEEYPDFIKEISLIDLTKGDGLLHYPYGSHLFALLRTRQLMVEKVSGDLPYGERIEKELSNIDNPILKGDAVESSLIVFSSYEPFMEFKTQFEKYLITDSQKKVVSEKEKDLAKTAKGVKAIDFTFRDKSDKMIALSDFKGKVVYIDIWATWCGPCLKEAPDWKTLHDKNKSKDIVFLGVSIDDEKDHAKWLKHIEKEGEVGVQIFAGKDAKAIKDPYEIKGIPRFILIGKDGKILNSMAMRPSNPEVQQMLDEALAK